MGTGVILLLYYISPTIYADDLYDMSSAVVQAIDIFNRMTPQEDIKICASQPESEEPQFNLTEIRCEVVWIGEIPRRQKFWNELVPELMQWLSVELIECGIHSNVDSGLDSEERHEIYRLINNNRSDWINAVQVMVFSLLPLIAEIHSKTVLTPRHKTSDTWLQDLTSDGGLNWGENWFAAYEFWYTAYEYRDMNYPSPLKYLQMVFEKSFETLTRLLVDYVSEPKSEPKSVPKSPTYVPKSPRRLSKEDKEFPDLEKLQDIYAE